MARIALVVFAILAFAVSGALSSCVISGNGKSFDLSQLQAGAVNAFRTGAKGDSRGYTYAGAFCGTVPCVNIENTNLNSNNLAAVCQQPSGMNGRGILVSSAWDLGTVTNSVSINGVQSGASTVAAVVKIEDGAKTDACPIKREVILNFYCSSSSTTSFVSESPLCVYNLNVYDPLFCTPATTTTSKAPVTTTSAPVTVKPVVVSTTAKPVVVAQTAPATTKAAPATTKAAPATTKAAPATTKAAPATTKAAPATTKAAPATTKAAATTQKVTTKAPVKPVIATQKQTTKKPVSATGATTKKPVATTKKPVATTKKPVATTKKPVATTKKPVAKQTAKPAHGKGGKASHGKGEKASHGKGGKAAFANAFKRGYKAGLLKGTKFAKLVHELEAAYEEAVLKLNACEAKHGKAHAGPVKAHPAAANAAAAHEAQVKAAAAAKSKTARPSTKKATATTKKAAATTKKAAVVTTNKVTTKAPPKAAPTQCVCNLACPAGNHCACQNGKPACIKN